MSKPEKSAIMTRSMRIKEIEAEIPFIAETLQEAGIDTVSIHHWGGNETVKSADLVEAFRKGFDDQIPFPNHWDLGSSDFTIYNDAFDTEVELCHENHIHVRSNDDVILNKFRLRWNRRGLNPSDSKAEPIMRTPNEA